MNSFTNFDVDFLLDLYGDNVIASLTDTHGIIKYVSDAYVKISGYKKNELLGASQNIVRHPDMPASIFKELWETITSGKTWKGEIKNLKKNKDFYWVKATVTPQRDTNGKIIGYASVRQDITDKKKATLLHKQIQNMLDNIEDGFLIFDKNFTVEESYSKSCLKILDHKTLLNKDIADILFYNDKEKKETFQFGCEQLFQTKCFDTKKIYLTLLPSHHHNDKYEYTIHYKILSDDRLLLLFHDITNQIELEKKIQHEQKMQKMYITIATNKEESIDLIHSFIVFLKKDFKQIDENRLKMELHTFKGLFAQLEMIHTIESIHTMETLLTKQKIDKNNIKKLENAFHKDIKLITDTFGSFFLDPITSVKVEINHIETLTSQVESIIEKANISKLNEVLESIKHMKEQSFFNMLNIHQNTIKNVAKRVNKELYPLEIIGSKELRVSEKFKEFSKSLVHIYRNSIVHGIEESYIRTKFNKNPIGKIKSIFEFDKNNIFLKISDDGQGIDVEEVTKKAIELKLTTQEEVNTLTNQEILQFIFSNEFSTIDYVDELSGRGVGLASVKYELLKLNGTVEIVNNRFKGLIFNFTIPYKENISNDASILSATILQTTKSFLTKDVKIKLGEIYDIKRLNITKYYSTIQLTGLCNVILVISLEEQLIEKILAFFLQSNSSKNKEKLKNTLSGEIINTLIGLSIEKFPNEYAQLVLDTPVILDKFIIQTFIEQNQTSLEKIDTEFGSLELAVIILNTTD